MNSELVPAHALCRSKATFGVIQSRKCHSSSHSLLLTAQYQFGHSIYQVLFLLVPMNMQVISVKLIYYYSNHSPNSAVLLLCTCSVDFLFQGSQKDLPHH